MTAARRRLPTILLVACGACGAPALAQVPIVRVLDGTSNARGVSGDGTVVAGSHAAAVYGHAFRWSITSGLRDLGALGKASSSAYAVSLDATCVVGESYGQAFRWTDETGMQPVWPFPRSSYATGVSGDGSVVVGSFDPDVNFHAFRWTAPNSLEDLGLLPGGQSADAFGVSADGTVVVGACILAAGGSYPQRAFRWTHAEGMQNLGVLPGMEESQAFAVSPDGTVVVGTSFSRSSATYRAFRWTQNQGMQDLGAFPGRTFFQARGVSNQGAVIVGTAYGPAPQKAFIWTPAGGMEDLVDFLAARGTPGVMGWIFEFAFDVSADGTAIVGSGQPPACSTNTAFVIYLDGRPDAACPANCDNSMCPPVLNVDDFLCFQTRFMQGDSRANCDQSTTEPILTVNDFVCFQQKFAAGCP